MLHSAPAGTTKIRFSRSTVRKSTSKTTKEETDGKGKFIVLPTNQQHIAELEYLGDETLKHAVVDGLVCRRILFGQSILSAGLQ